MHVAPDRTDVTTATTDRSRWLALTVLCGGMLMIVLDVTVVNVALPVIQDDLGFSQAGLAWVVNSYLIAFGGLLLLAGRVGDLVSRRSVFLTGLALFTLASLLCGLAQSQAMLIGARFLQGVGGALTSAVILGIIVTIFPEPRERARAISLYAFVASAGGSIGLLAGGVLTQAISWHWIFFINVPVGAVVISLALRLLEKDTGGGLGRGADFLGAVLITSALMLAVYTIVEPGSRDGWLAGTTLTYGGIAVALLAAFVMREAMAKSPLIPLGLFRSIAISGANIIQVLSTAGLFGMFFLGVLYLQQVMGAGALETGLAFLPTTIVMGILSVRYAERLIMRWGALPTLLPGLTLVAAGLALFARVPVDGSYVVDILPTTLLIGTGGGISFPALMTLAMSESTPADAGLASGLINTSAEVGAAVGLAVLATLSAARTAELSARGEPLAAALTEGYRFGFWVAAALVAVAVVIALTLMSWRRRTVNAYEPECCAEAVVSESG